MSEAPRIHPSAVIEAGAAIGPGVAIGPFCHVGPQVVLGPGVTLDSHVVVTGDTALGEGTRVFPFAVVGGIPQDLKYKGEATRLRIGARNRIREHVTINLGTAQGGGETVIGDDCLIMAGAHVAHDVRIGNRVILVNSAAIAGHCVLGDDVIVGGLSGVHQWVRIGQGAIIGAVTMVAHDVLPFGLVSAPRGELEGLNLVGLKRRGVDRAGIAALRAAYDGLKRGEGAFAERARRLRDGAEDRLVQEMLDFVLTASDRQFLTPK